MSRPPTAPLRLPTRSTTQRSVSSTSTHSITDAPVSSPSLPRPSTAPSSGRNDASPSSEEERSIHLELQPKGSQPSFTWVCLGVGGGPIEGDCSCYLLKPADQEWSEGSVVVEGGSWLGALTRVLEVEGPQSAFADVAFPHDSAALKAGYIGSFAQCFLISHAHLDHILGLVLGSASLPGKRAVWGLRGTLENILDLFNGKLWPRLASFKEDEPHTVYHLRSLENQCNTALSSTLSVLPFALSHGLNPSQLPAPPTPKQHDAAPTSRSTSYFSKRYSLPLSAPSLSGWNPPPASGAQSSPATKLRFTSPFAPDRSSASAALAASNPAAAAAAATSGISPRTPDHVSEESYSDAGSNADALAPGTSLDVDEVPSSASALSQRRAAAGGGSGGAPPPIPPRRVAGLRSRRPRTAQGSEKHVDTMRNPTSLAPSGSAPRRVSLPDSSPPALDSTAFFITHKRTGCDVLFFGDVEPDCVSQSPRNRRVWQHAAARFAVAQLNCVFLECSFPAAHPTEFLYGHLSVNHLFDELRTLARCVVLERRRREALKRNPAFASAYAAAQASSSSRGGGSSSTTVPPPLPASPMPSGAVSDAELSGALTGLTFIIIHIKTALFPSYEAEQKDKDEQEEALSSSSSRRRRVVDPRTMQDRILDELREMEVEVGLGARFEIAKQGMRITC